MWQLVDYSNKNEEGKVYYISCIVLFMALLIVFSFIIYFILKKM